jgi:hypothetical protein
MPPSGKGASAWFSFPAWQWLRRMSPREHSSISRCRPPQPSAQLRANFSAFNTNLNTGTTLAQQVYNVIATGPNPGTSDWTQYSLNLPASLVSASFSSWIGTDVSIYFGTANGVPVVVDVVSLDATVFQSFEAMSPSRWVARLRAQRAAFLLRTTTLAVRDVGAQVGFEDPFHFSRFCRQHMGVSPRAYRSGHECL